MHAGVSLVVGSDQTVSLAFVGLGSVLGESALGLKNMKL